MSAAVQATIPRYHEALCFWDDFSAQCQRHIDAINAVASEHQMSQSEGVHWQSDSLRASMIRAAIPSTEINLGLAFEEWGPKIIGSVRGQQQDDLHFYPEEFEFAIATDQDDSVVAVAHEGRSLSPHEFAKYVVQHFRRSYPGITLPCPDSPLK